VTGRAPTAGYFLDDLARAWRRIPLPLALRKIAAGPIGVGLAWLRRRTPPPALAPIDQIEAGDLVVSGFFSEVLGIGSAGRMTVEALRRVGLDPILDDIAFLRTEALYARRPLPGRPRGGVWISHCNAPELDLLLNLHRSSELASRYRIGYWAWETEALPMDWARMVDALHELWVPSRFVQGAVRQSTDPASHHKVRVAPHPTRDMGVVTPDRARFGLSADAMVVLVMADLRSTSARKNPLGSIEAYVRAFPAPSPSVQMVCKVVATGADQDAYAHLRARFADRHDIAFLTEEMDDLGVWTLMASSDVLLSLHRSEGYGLTLSEAMQLGRCVVATAWSGNMDFMDDEVGVLIPYSLAPISSDSGPYAVTKGHWAEPDLDAAAAALVALQADPKRRARLGHAAKTRIANHQAGFYAEIIHAPWRMFVAET
jgi:hypothetical protein